MYIPPKERLTIPMLEKRAEELRARINKLSELGVACEFEKWQLNIDATKIMELKTKIGVK